MLKLKSLLNLRICLIVAFVFGLQFNVNAAQDEHKKNKAHPKITKVEIGDDTEATIGDGDEVENAKPVKQKKCTVEDLKAGIQIAGPTQEQVTKDLKECAKAKKRFTFLANDKVECDDNYLLFQPQLAADAKASLKFAIRHERETAPQSKDAALAEANSNGIKIGSFNIMRTGQDQTQFKDMNLVAKIINQWDIVAAVELMTITNPWISYNENFDDEADKLEALKGQLSQTEYQKLKNALDQSYHMPGYLAILKALRNLDPSWSLIMAARSSGDSTSNLEMGGFFFRSSLVSLKESELCGGAFGCLLATEPKLDKIVSRSPFVASFNADNFDFNGLALHFIFI
jgi:hypothetical protein